MAWRPLLLLLPLLLLPAPRDLDIGIPPGPPTTWSRHFPAITPPRGSLFPLTPSGAPRVAPGNPSGNTGRGTVVQPKTAELDVRISSTFGVLRIITQDLPGHLPWAARRADDRGPVTGFGAGGPLAREPRQPTAADSLHWICMTALLRVLLHPQLVSEKETIAHLVEIGEPVLGVLDAAAAENALAPMCAKLKVLIGTRTAAPLRPPGGGDAGSREGMLRRFFAEELTSCYPHDPEGTFGRRVFALADEAEPYLREMTRHADSFLRRNAVQALGRYQSTTAQDALVDLAVASSDPVVRVRALAALGRCRTLGNAKPLLDRFARVEDPVERVALIEALGGAAVQDAVPALLTMSHTPDPDTLQALLSALAQIRSESPAAIGFARSIAKGAHDHPERYRVRSPVSGIKPDVVDSPEARGEVVEQLALILLARSDPRGEDARRRLLALSDPRAGDIAPAPGGRPRSARLGSVHPPALFLCLDALRDLGDAGVARLREVAADRVAEASVRGYALSRLPYFDRGDLAVGILRGSGEDTEAKIQALEVLAADGHGELPVLARDLLRSCARAEAGDGTAEQRYLWLCALRALETQRQLTAADVLPLLHHARAKRSDKSEGFMRGLVERITRQIGQLVEASAEGQPKARRRELIDALLDLVVENGLDRRITAATRDEARVYVEGLLAGLAGRGAELRYRNNVINAVSDFLLGPRRHRPQQLGEFVPAVQLEEEMLLALGRTRTEQAGNALVAFLDEARDSCCRAWAALALGMAGQPRLASRLVLVLLEQDGFTRFCAYESLRHLTGQEFWADWIYGSEGERFAAAQRYRAAPARGR